MTTDDEDNLTGPHADLTEAALLDLLEKIRTEHPRILDGDVPYNCPSCGRPPTETAIRCREFDLRYLFRSQTVLVGLYADFVLLMFSDKANEKNVLLSKEEAHALASRLHRYAEELP